MNRSLHLRVLGISILLVLAVETADARLDVRPRTTLSGVLQVVQEDDFDGVGSRLIHRLLDPTSGEVYTLSFEGTAAPRWRSGATVTARGRLSGRELRVGPGDVVLHRASTMATLEEHSAVVLVVDFSDRAVDCAEQQIADLMFGAQGSVDGMFREASFGDLAFPGDTDGDGGADVFRVALDQPLGTGCSTEDWTAAANEAATGQGLDLGPYQHRVYVLPDEAECGWAGRASLGCFGPCVSWIRTCGLADVYAHELGHNLGLYHASTDEDNDGAVDCEYCDRSDVMGIGGVGLRQLNGPHKLAMGWLPATQLVAPGPGGELHVLSPLEIAPDEAAYPQLLHVERPGSSHDYYLSYRRRLGYDASLNGLYADRLSVHTHSGTGNTLFVDSLADGEEFVDAPNGIRVTQVSHDAESLTVLVEIPGEDEPPSPVTDLSGVANRRNRVRLEWSAVPDTGPLTYRVYRDGAPIGSTSRTRFLDLRVSELRTYSYEVRAVDAAGRESEPTVAIEVTVGGSQRLRGEGSGRLTR